MFDGTSQQADGPGPNTVAVEENLLWQLSAPLLALVAANCLAAAWDSRPIWPIEVV
jgi:hypothetical protein